MVSELDASEEMKHEIERYVVQRSMSWSAPYPDPDMLGRFEEVLPGSADRILAMAEHQASHRQDLERQSVQNGIYLSQRALWLGYSLALILIVGGLILIYLERPVEGLISIGIPVVTVSVSWIWERLSKPRELEDKRSDVEPEDHARDAR